MAPIVLTQEEKDLALAEALKTKETREKGTSAEIKPDQKVLLEMSPEMREALSKGIADSMKDLWSNEIELRKKKTGESHREASAVLSGVAETSFQKRARQQKENEFIALYTRGRALKQKEDVQKAYELEAEYLGRETRGKKLLEQRAMGGSTAGDEFIPEVFETRVIENIEELGLARKNCLNIPMTTDTHKFPKISTNIIAYEVAAGAQITASDLVTAQVTLSSRKLATITAMYNELILNANPAIGDILTRMASLAFANKEDTLVFTGASSTVTGVLESTAVTYIMGGSSSSGKDTLAEITFDDLFGLVDALGSQYINNRCAFYFNKKVLLHLRQLKATDSGTYLWTEPSNGNPGTIAGFPYYTSSVMPSAPAANTAFAFFGDLSNYYFGDRQQMQVALGTEGTVGSDNLFEKDMSAIRTLEHVGMVGADFNGLAVLKTSTT